MASSFSGKTLNPTVLVSNIFSLISIRLEHHNYLLWRSQFLPVLRAHGLLGFVTGTFPYPPQFLLDSNNNLSSEINTDYTDWITQNQHLLSWINAILSESVLAYVVRLSTSSAVWKVLERRFAFLSRSHIIQLKTQIQTIKKGDQKISEFLQSIKSIVDTLSAVYSPIDDEDLLLYTLNGLPDEYGPFKKAI